MLQIDDAGWGCLVGGVTVGCYRVETAEFVAGTVAPAYFQDADPHEPNHFQRQDYRHAAAHVVEVCLAQLKATPAEPVATLAPAQNRSCSAGVGSGDVLDDVRAWLTAQGYRWQAAKITGPLRELVEYGFQAHLAGLGFNVSFDLLTEPNKAGLLWWRQIQLLKGGDVNIMRPDPARAAVCKTGWSTYLTWAYHPYAEARALAGRAKRRQAYPRN